MEPTTRHSLVLRLRNRDDEAAWAEFLAIYEPLIYGLARRKGLQDAVIAHTALTNSHKLYSMGSWAVRVGGAPACSPPEKTGGAGGPETRSVMRPQHGGNLRLT